MKLKSLPIGLSLLCLFILAVPIYAHHYVYFSQGQSSLASISPTQSNGYPLINHLVVWSGLSYFGGGGSTQYSWYATSTIRTQAANAINEWSNYIPPWGSFSQNNNSQTAWLKIHDVAEEDNVGSCFGYYTGFTVFGCYLISSWAVNWSGHSNKVSTAQIKIEPGGKATTDKPKFTLRHEIGHAIDLYEKYNDSTNPPQCSSEQTIMNLYGCGSAAIIHPNDQTRVQNYWISEASQHNRYEGHSISLNYGDNLLGTFKDYAWAEFRMDSVLQRWEGNEWKAKANQPSYLDTGGHESIAGPRPRVQFELDGRPVGYYRVCGRPLLGFDNNENRFRYGSWGCTGYKHYSG